jgi:hypothetical protein
MKKEEKGAGWILDQQAATITTASIKHDGSSLSYGGSVVAYGLHSSSYTHTRISTTWITLMHSTRNMNGLATVHNEPPPTDRVSRSMYEVVLPTA